MGVHFWHGMELIWTNRIINTEVIICYSKLEDKPESGHGNTFGFSPAVSRSNRKERDTPNTTQPSLLLKKCETLEKEKHTITDPNLSKIRFLIVQLTLKDTSK